MLHPSRALVLGGAILAALTTSACSAEQTGSDGASSAGVSDVAAGGTAAPSSWAEPTEVVTDPPISLGPVDGGEVFLTHAGWDDAARAVTARGYLQGVVEEDGTCTLTLTKGGRSVTATKAGASNVTTTACGGLSVPAGELSSGTWTAVLSYASSTSSGSSEAVEVEVP